MRLAALTARIAKEISIVFSPMAFLMESKQLFYGIPSPMSFSK